MSSLSGASACSVTALPAAGQLAAPGRELEVFAPAARRGGWPGRIHTHLRSPLGIYSVPLLIGVVWQIASWQGRVVSILERVLLTWRPAYSGA